MQTRLRDQYDWVVIGDHPGALLSASLAARLGMTVLVVPLNINNGLTLTQKGQYWDPEPGAVVGLLKGDRVQGLVAACLGKLGILPFEAELAQSRPAGFQVATPSGRWTFGSGELLGQELSRELGRDGLRETGFFQAIRKAEADYIGYWAQLPKRLTLSAVPRSRAAAEKGTLEGLRKQLLKAPGLEEAASKQWLSKRTRFDDLSEALGEPVLTEGLAAAYYGILGTPLGNGQMDWILQVLAQSRVTACFKGGMTAYREFLLNLGRRLGVQVPLKVDCRRLFVEKGRLTAIQVAGRAQPIAVGQGVLGCSVKRAATRSTFTGRALMHRFKTGARPVGWRFCLALTVSEEALSSALSSRVIWNETGAPPVEIELVHPTDYGVPANGKRIVYLRTVLPFEAETLTLAYQRVVAARLLKLFNDLVPFSEFHISNMYPDFREGEDRKPVLTGNVSGRAGEDAESPKPRAEDPHLSPLTEAYGFASLDLIPDHLRVYGGAGLGSKSGIEGLYLASDESYPELGSFGGVVAGLEAVAAIAHRAGLAGPFV